VSNHTTTALRVQLGNIHYAPVAFHDLPQSKVRPVLVVSISAKTVVVRPFYTKSARGRRLVQANGYNGLHHQSYLSGRTQTISRSRIGRQLGSLEDHLDPFGDFSAAA
jgi:hypothetical protein